jgi:hypothetical protein
MAICKARLVIVAMAVILAGCATPERAPDPPPPVYVPESTWQQVDHDIGAASAAARRPAENYARGSMKAWLARVRQRTEADFIPWYTGYWTQQWLAIKVAWYKLSGGDGDRPDRGATGRLSAGAIPGARAGPRRYGDRSRRRPRAGDETLRPAPRRADPGNPTTLRCPPRPVRPAAQGDSGDRAAAASRPPRFALPQTVHALPINELPAYVALLARIHKEAGGGGAGPSNARISPVAKRASEKLVARLAASGGASAAAAAVGGVAGAVISLGAAGIGAMTHEKERPEMEAQLRESLNAALDDMWHSLMEDPATGVMAAVDHIAGQVEGSLIRSRGATGGPGTGAAGELPLPGEPPRHEATMKKGRARMNRMATKC